MGGETTGVSYHGDEHETESTSNLVPPHRGETNDIVLAQAPPPKGKYADVSFLINIRVLWFALKSLVLHPKSMKRHTTITFIRWITGTCNYKEIQFLMPPSVDAYLQWTKRQKPRMEPFIEPLIDDAMVMWVGKKRTDRVVLYMPGGAYFFPLSGNAISFWRYVQLELESQGIDVGLAILAYSLIPEAGFPTQLRQAQVALEHILASGVHPSNLHLPKPASKPSLPEPASKQGAPPTCPHTFMPIRGVYLMSPWVCMESTTASSRANFAYDIIVPSPSGSDAPTDSGSGLGSGSAWFAGLDGIVDRLLMTAGGKEVLRDDIIAFSQTMGKVKRREFGFVVQEGGVHVDPLLEFMFMDGKEGKSKGKGKDNAKGEGEVRSLTPMIVSWLAAGYRSS
ncbi:hypothetical protein CPB84DRAFT_1777614 [Gymnopilus junonius]|uniref:Uncharacterized protein n=1 Tax=Gymnopilus junonius TaxID=109634 RepID=A0A9P5NRA8_GYMJU|nr:hypothetical protein CPB84DRAFT_1777614 [Gymnopilus junonius]